MRRLIVLNALAACAFVLGGCTSYTDETGRIVFRPRQSETSEEQVDQLRRDARLSELESAVTGLRSDVEEINASVNSVSSRTDATLRQTDSRSTESLTALRAEVVSLNERLNAVETKLNAIPTSFSKLLDEQRASIMADVDKSIRAKVTSSSSSSGSRRTSSSASSGSSSSGSSGGTGRYYEHQVEEGQTLSEIAKAYSVSVSEILNENNIKDASTIRVGQKLLIPAK